MKILIALCCLAMLPTSLFAWVTQDILWTGGSPSNSLWSTPANWDLNRVPHDGDVVYVNDEPGCLIDSTVSATCGDITESWLVGLGIGWDPWGSKTGIMDMTGGSLTITQGDLGLGLTVNCVGTLNMSGGTINILSRNLTVGYGWGGQGNLNMTGGLINIAGWLDIVHAGAPTTGYVNLHGGTIIVGTAFFLNDGGLMDITTGTLIISGDVRSTLRTYITATKLTAYSGLGTFNIDYNVSNMGKTTVTATDPNLASDPVPSNGQKDVYTDLTLSWKPGMGAVTHDIYFGTDTNAVADATHASDEFIDNVDVNSYYYGKLNSDMVHCYWRIDELNGSGVVIAKGNVWNFTTKYTPQAGSCQGGFYMAGDLNKDCNVDFRDFAIMADEWLNCNDMFSPSCGNSAAKEFLNTKTIIQTAASYDPRIDIAVDGLYIWGPPYGPVTKIRPWRQRDYVVASGVDGNLDMGSFYTNGDWDGISHTEDIELNSAGQPYGFFDPIMPYVNTTENFSRYIFESEVEPGLAEGADAVITGETTLHLQSGYEQSFKDLWVPYYNRPWLAENSSAYARFLTGQLKSSLVANFNGYLSQHAKSYGKQRNNDIGLIIAMHPIFGFAGGLVAPFGSTAKTPEIDGYVAQVWSNEVEGINNSYSSPQKSYFSTSYLLYDSCTQLAVENNKKVWFLIDPAGDYGGVPPTWAQLRQMYEDGIASQMFLPDIDSYEVDIWPDRVFLPGLGTGGGTPAPESYRSEILSVIQAQQEMPLGGQWIGNISTGIGVAVADSVLWQSSDIIQGCFSMLMPLVEKGVPAASFLMERSDEPDYLKRFKVIVLCYENFKPVNVSMNLNLINWVNSGGVLVILGGYGDSFDTASQMWWHNFGYNSALEHLVAGLGGVPNSDSNWSKGLGWVYRKLTSPSAFANPATANTIYYPLINSALIKAGESAGLLMPCYFHIKRGDFVTGRSTTNTLNITGKLVNIFDANLPVLNGVTLTAGQSGLYRDVTDKLTASRPAVLHCTHRLMSEEYNPSTGNLLFTIKGPTETPAVVRLYPYNKSNISAYDHNNNAVTVTVYNEGSTYKLKFPNDPNGITVQLY